MRHVTITGTAALGAPAGFDPVTYISRSLARVPWPWQVEVLLHTPLQEAERQLPATLADLTAAGNGTLLRMRVTSLDWMAALLAGLGCDFTIHGPAELRGSVQTVAARLAASAS
jgi:predicted DNA-binding transcriptional regulator YafY